jgi:hypothetical protein
VKAILIKKRQEKELKVLRLTRQNLIQQLLVMEKEYNISVESAMAL